MIKVGITGGIGSGKSTVSKIFASLGIPVFDSDQKGREVINYPEIVNALVARFGDEILTGEMPDRKKIASRVFASPPDLEFLNSLVHPAVKKAFLEWAGAFENASHAYVLKEAAILFESGAYRQVDKVIVVDAPEEIRIERVVKRDGVSPEDVRKRMERQWKGAALLEKADFVIHNPGDVFLIPQALNIHRELSEKYIHL